MKLVKREKSKSIPKLEEFSEIFFSWQTKIETEGQQKGLGSGGNFRKVFQKTIETILKHDENRQNVLSMMKPLFKEKMRISTEIFFQEFKNIKMKDTLYSDTQSGLAELFTTVDGIVLTTTGDLKYQSTKIDKSGVYRILKKAKSTTINPSIYIRFLLAPNKEAKIPQYLDEFIDYSKSSSIIIFIYEDNPEKFKYVNQYLLKWEQEQGLIIEKAYVWTKRGRIADDMTVKKEQEIRKSSPPFEVVENISQLISLIKQRKNDNCKIIVFLDFDGALSDNRIMRLRQAKVAYKHAVNLLNYSYKNPKFALSQLIVPL